MKLKRNQQIGVLVGAGVLFLGGLVYLGMLMSETGDVWPFYNEPGTHQNDINKLNKSIADLRKKIRDIEDVRLKLKETEQEYRLAVRVLPSENHPDQLLAAIRDKAIQSGAQPNKIVSEIRTGALGMVTGSSGGRNAVTATAQRSRGAQGMKNASGNFDEWVFTLDMMGTYDQIASFINTMEEFESNDGSQTGSERRFFHINQLELIASYDTLNYVYTEDTDKKQGNPLYNLHKCRLAMSTFRYTGNDD